MSVIQAPANSALALDLHGQRLWLLPERAVYSPALRTLWVADVHLGKAASFRAAALPVPRGTTADNLQRLAQLIERWQPERLVFLGDLLHSAAARTPAVLQGLAGLAQRFAPVQLVLVRGNHDHHAGDPPEELGMATVTEPWVLGPFASCHHPQPHPGHTVLAGHVHPVCALQGPGRDRLRLPCFVHTPGQLLLPAFGSWTGGHTIAPAAATQCRYAIGAERVWAVDAPLTPPPDEAPTPRPDAKPAPPQAHPQP